MRIFNFFCEILFPIKEKLQDESSFFWSIFGGNYYLKLMFYEEGLIKFDQILLAIQNNFKSLSTEYFLPEVLENDQEFFEKKIKYWYNTLINLKSNEKNIQKITLINSKSYEKNILNGL